MNSEWIQCVRWCHWAEDQASIDALIETLVDLCLRSNYSSPILTNSRDDFGIRTAGYIVMYPGALASIGPLRSESSDSESIYYKFADSVELERKCQVELARELFQAAFDQGAEIVQAITPLVASRLSYDLDSAFVSTDPQRDLVFGSAGMIPVAKLVQMECFGIQTIPRQAVPALGLDCGELDFILYHEILPNQWSQLVERTYIETRDVPELNGLRGIESTLAGYASTIHGVPKTWWVVQCKGINIGCLLLTPTAARWCEITYLGLVPQWRGRGLSKVIMNFVRDWALASGIDGITLAVDLRNRPAIRLYQSCGFMTDQFVQAWICFPNRQPDVGDGESA